ncbi:MAG: SDR family oxidoreductase [Candidatus Scalindua sp.]|nr:SDR family oxidoreductase [Candidatus Scalindua sp.]
MKHALIVGGNSGIGEDLAKRYTKDNVKVIGTYRQTPGVLTESSSGVDFYQLDVTNPENIDSFIEYLRDREYRWDIIVFSVGTLEPIGNFYDLDFNQWEQSYTANYFGQLRVMHGVRKLANPGATVIFFTGGAPSGVLQRFSAYSVAKIGLTKMVEYLDVEDKEVKYAIVGPGWVNTRIHEQTIAAGEDAGSNLQRTQLFLEKGEVGTPLQDIYGCINWIASKSKQMVGGRNFSVVWDAWGDKKGSEDLESNLSHDDNLFKIRRFEG